MTHKVHPKIYRIKEITDWDSRGFYEDPAQYLEEDFKIRELLKRKLAKVGVEKIEIERFPGKINIIISSARPGLIIGRGGEGVEQLKKMLEEKIFKKKPSQIYSKIPSKDTRKSLEVERSKIRAGGGKSTPLVNKREGEETREMRLEIREVKNPWASANLTAQWVAQQIEKRVPYRRVLKQTLSKVSANKQIKGARIELSGRLGGTEIARREWLKVGRLPLQTLRSDIDYAGVQAYCTYGVIGIKVWLYKGEKFD